MNATTKLLTDHLDIWTAADTEKKSGRGRSAAGSNSLYGIKKLRELILELAVRGKLVPQDPNDEPASELIKKIESERARLVKNGEIKSEKPFPKIDKTETPFELPHGWRWVRLSQIGHDWGQTTPEAEFTYIDVSAIDSALGRVFCPAIVEAADAPSRARKVVHKGTVIYSTVRPYLLNVAVVEQEFTPKPVASTAFAVVHPFCGIPPRFVLAFLRSPVFVRYVESVQTGIAYPAINDKQFFSGLIPLPPLAEQHRIVVKVDALMALCDQLEAGQAGAAEAHEKLVSHLLGTLTQSQDAEDFAANWQRIATDFDTLFTTESSIDALKQTVLQLAVMGKLVPQNPTDEPVTKLLSRVASGQRARIENKEIQRPQKIITDSVPNIEIPKSWEFKLLGELAFVTKLAGFEYTDHLKLTDEGEVPVIRAQNVRPFLIEKKNLKYIDLQTSLKLARSAVDRPCLLITFIGAGIGDVCYFQEQERWHLAPNVAKAEPFAELSLNYLTLYMNSPSGRFEIFKSLKSTAQPSLSMGTIREIWVPIPPLPEQHRIVAKVDELMALCDRLKARLLDANRLQQTLADALVSQAAA